METVGCKMTHDVRVIANVVLNEASLLEREITNLHLNKILYFMHVESLIRFGKPLVSAKIEAWKHGPVFREIYNQFKSNKDRPIKSLAQKVDFETGQKVPARSVISQDEITTIKKLARYYSGMPAGMLVDMSHTKGGAWSRVWNHVGQMNIGMEITDELILQHEAQTLIGAGQV